MQKKTLLENMKEKLEVRTLIQNFQIKSIDIFLENWKFRFRILIWEMNEFVELEVCVDLVKSDTWLFFLGPVFDQ